MKITTSITWDIATGKVLQHSFYEYSGAVDLLCGPSAGEREAADNQKDLAANVTKQAKDVFGNDNKVFNDEMGQLSKIVGGGLGQHGFTQAVLNSLNGSALVNGANAARFAGASVRNAQSGFAGGNTTTNSGVNTAQNLSVANAAAGNTANELNKIQQADFATGRENFFNAAGMEQKLPDVYNNLPGLDKSATDANQQSLQDQTQMNSESNWWVKPVMGLATGALGAVTGGIGNLDMTGGSSFGEQVGNFFSGAAKG